MIGEITVDARRPQIALEKISAYKGSPQNIRILNIPKKIGTWEITSVYMWVNMPDNTASNYDCVKINSTWVGGIPACDVVGTSVNGFQIKADGVDENGDDVVGYVIGAGDFEIVDGASEGTQGETQVYLRFFTEEPSDPNAGDTVVDGTPKIYDGDQWKYFWHDPDLTDYYTKGEVQEISSDLHDEIPTKTSELTNDSGFLTSHQSLANYLPLSGGTLTGDLTIDNGNQSGALILGDGCMTPGKIYLNPYGISPEGCYSGGSGCGCSGPNSAEWSTIVATANGCNTAYATADQLTSYLPLGGGTLTGNLTIAVGCGEHFRMQSNTAALDLSLDGGQYSSGCDTTTFYWPGYGNSTGCDNSNEIATMDAIEKNSRYKQSSNTLYTSLILTDKTFNTYDARSKSSSDTVSINMPGEKYSGKVRDVLLRIDTGCSAPTLTFSDAIYISTGDDDWQTLEANSYNIFSFTNAGTGGCNKSVWLVGRTTKEI